MSFLFGSSKTKVDCKRSGSDTFTYDKPVSESKLTTPFISEDDKKWIQSHKFYYVACYIFLSANVNLYFDYQTKEAIEYTMNEDEFQKYCEVYNINFDMVTVEILQNTISGAHKKHNIYILTGYTVKFAEGSYPCYSKNCSWTYPDSRCSCLRGTKYIWESHRPWLTGITLSDKIPLGNSRVAQS